MWWNWIWQANLSIQAFCFVLFCFVCLLFCFLSNATSCEDPRLIGATHLQEIRYPGLAFKTWLHWRNKHWLFIGSWLWGSMKAVLFIIKKDSRSHMLSFLYLMRKLNLRGSNNLPGSPFVSDPGLWTGAPASCSSSDPKGCQSPFPDEQSGGTWPRGCARMKWARACKVFQTVLSPCSLFLLSCA